MIHNEKGLETCQYCQAEISVDDNGVCTICKHLQHEDKGLHEELTS